MAKAILICGRICTGKTTYAESLCHGGKAVPLSIDGLMLAMLEPYLGDMHEVYTARAEIYLKQKAVEIINAGCDVVLDWGFWKKARRQEIKEFFTGKGIDCKMHYLDISDREWQKRIATRNALVKNGQADAYYVDEKLAAKFRSLFEKPDKSEIDVWTEQ